MEVKPPCIYGSKCYRKNAQHFLEYFHPKDLGRKDVPEKEAQNGIHLAKKLKLHKNNNETKGNLKDCTSKMKQTTLLNYKTELKFAHCRKHSQSINDNKIENENAEKSLVDNQDDSDGEFENNSEIVINDTNISKEKNLGTSFKHNNDFKSEEGHVPVAQETNFNKKNIGNSGWIFVKKTEDDNKKKLEMINLLGKSPEAIIKYLFLVDMPSCFYSFFNFCKSLNNEEPENSLQSSNLKLVGPFDVLLGKMNLSVNKDTALCHWRYYYDPPEFQTVLANDSGFHIGYWRDDPKDSPVFVASNNDKNCIFKTEAENLFGAVFHYLEKNMKIADPFNKIKVLKLQTALKEWAQKFKFSLEKSTKTMATREKKVVTKSFHKLGLVVPVKKKTDIGYRPLLVTDVNLKRICKNIINADNESERDALWEELQPLITAANIANDECDFGNSLELGINLFCMGSPIFHQSVEHLLSVAYSLLNRNSFGKIIKAHLKMRKTGHQLSVN